MFEVIVLLKDIHMSESYPPNLILFLGYNLATT